MIWATRPAFVHLWLLTLVWYGGRFDAWALCRTEQSQPLPTEWQILLAGSSLVRWNRCHIIINFIAVMPLNASVDVWKRPTHAPAACRRKAITSERLIIWNFNKFRIIELFIFARKHFIALLHICDCPLCELPQRRRDTFSRYLYGRNAWAWHIQYLL